MAPVGENREPVVRHAARGALVSFVVILIFGACSGQGDDLSDVNTAQIASVERSVGFDGDIVRLGVIANLTGAGATLDRARLTGASAYWADVNIAGGLSGRYEVELVIVDHRGDPQIAAAAIPELLSLIHI